MHLLGMKGTRGQRCCKHWNDVGPTQRPRVPRIRAAQVRVTGATFSFRTSHPLSPVTLTLYLPTAYLLPPPALPVALLHVSARTPQVGDVIITLVSRSVKE